VFIVKVPFIDISKDQVVEVLHVELAGAGIVTG
jgi:hypothetical protein